MVSERSQPVARESSRSDAERYLIVSGDAHAGPSLERQLRPYCPARHISEFDEFARHVKAAQSARPNRATFYGTKEALEAYDVTKACPGSQDPHAFLRDMDEDGIAAEVIFAGGQNEEVLPWIGNFDMGSVTIDGRLRAVGCRIWNSWLADFTAVAPKRLIGVMQIPIWDIDAAIEEVRWGKDHGLGAINFAAPRTDLVPYNDDAYERFWSAVEEVDLPLVCHAGSGQMPAASGRGAYMIYSAQVFWLSRQALPQMLFGGVFDRHPGLRLVFTEQRASWVGATLRDFDSCYLDPNREYPDKPPKRPSEYWATNCGVAASFMAPFEADMRYEIGLRNLLWGTDYPHVEGTWPHTRLALRNTFAHVPEHEVRMILGDNPVHFYGLDASALRLVADRIGPMPEELSVPLSPDELPAHRGLAFRESGIYA